MRGLLQLHRPELALIIGGIALALALVAPLHHSSAIALTDESASIRGAVVHDRPAARPVATDPAVQRAVAERVARLTDMPLATAARCVEASLMTRPSSVGRAIWVGVLADHRVDDIVRHEIAIGLVRQVGDRALAETFVDCASDPRSSPRWAHCCIHYVALCAARTPERAAVIGMLDALAIHGDAGVASAARWQLAGMRRDGGHPAAAAILR
ncbi:MAG TPA: hypothetical protein VEL07_05290 [Planctomycetota bacterium]|nr:hypothetical protein [Planctomycetota bacterium]